LASEKKVKEQVGEENLKWGGTILSTMRRSRSLFQEGGEKGERNRHYVAQDKIRIKGKGERRGERKEGKPTKKGVVRQV